MDDSRPTSHPEPRGDEPSDAGIHSTAERAALHNVVQGELSYEELRDIIDLSLWAGQMLLQHGASSERVEETVHRMGTGLGCNWMDVLVSVNWITITATSGEEFRTKTRRIVRLGVNFSVVSAVNELGRRVSAGKLDRIGLRAELERTNAAPVMYGRRLTVLMVALACAAFCRLFGGDWIAVAATFVAAGTAMIVRQEMARRYFNPYMIVVVSAFVAGLLSSSVAVLELSATPDSAIVASVLLLVPGVPLINSAQDLIKGYTTNGITRGFVGVLISLAIAIGLLFALGLMEVRFP